MIVFQREYFKDNAWKCNKCGCKYWMATEKKCSCIFMSQLVVKIFQTHQIHKNNAIQV